MLSTTTPDDFIVSVCVQYKTLVLSLCQSYPHSFFNLLLNISKLATLFHYF